MNTCRRQLWKKKPSRRKTEKTNGNLCNSNQSCRAKTSTNKRGIGCERFYLLIRNYKGKICSFLLVDVLFFENNAPSRALYVKNRGKRKPTGIRFKIMLTLDVGFDLGLCVVVSKAFIIDTLNMS